MYIFSHLPPVVFADVHQSVSDKRVTALEALEMFTYSYNSNKFTISRDCVYLRINKGDELTACFAIACDPDLYTQAQWLYCTFSIW